jgi:hypothetical protein
MNALLHPDRTPGHPREHRLLAEIAWYESRLREIVNGGECAYEKALARSFEQALAGHRERLAALRTG